MISIIEEAKEPKPYTTLDMLVAGQLFKFNYSCVNEMVDSKRLYMFLQHGRCAIFDMQYKFVVYIDKCDMQNAVTLYEGTLTVKEA